MLPPGSEWLQSSRVSQLQTSRPSPICDKGSGNNGNRTGQKRLPFLSRNTAFGFKRQDNWVSFLQTLGDSINLGYWQHVSLFCVYLYWLQNIHKLFQNSLDFFFFTFLRKWSCWLTSQRTIFFSQTGTSAEEWKWNWTCWTELRNSLTH